MKRQGRLGKSKYEPQWKGSSRDSPFTSIFLLFCQFVVMGGHCSLHIFLHFYTSPSSTLFLFCLSHKLAICCLVEGAELFSSHSPILTLSPWESMLWKELIIGWHSFRSPDLSVYLPLSLSFLLHFLASHTTPSFSIHLISSEDEDWWRYFRFFSFHHHAVECFLCFCVPLNTHYCPSLSVKSVSVDELLRDR